jgi:hypothetical protein
MEKRNARRNLVENPGGKTPLGRTRSECDNNSNKINLRETG